MANNDDLILRGKALRDLRGIKDVLLAQGDPFLANILNRAIECIENQPKVAENMAARVAELEAELAAALKDLAETTGCEYCKHGARNNPPIIYATCLADCEECEETCACYKCENGDAWEWRGARGKD